MSQEKEKVKNTDMYMPGEEEFSARLRSRHQRGTVGKWFKLPLDYRCHLCIDCPLRQCR